MTNRIFVVVPTFREADSLRRLLTCFVAVRAQGVSLVVVNANPGDESSRILAHYRSHLDVSEVLADPSLFWSGLVNRGIGDVLRRAAQNDYLMLMNVDVEFHENIFDIMRKASAEHNGCQIGALVYSGRNVISSGVQVRSWLLGLNRHPFAGMAVAEVPRDIAVDVDFLPTRCILIPLAAVREVGSVDAKRFPHYGGDYEYTLRLKRHGWRPILHTSARIESDIVHTGVHAFNDQRTLMARLKGMLDVKCAYNPLCRARFVWLTYPVYARLPASLAYCAKSIVEWTGGNTAKHCMRKIGGAYSGRIA